LATHSGAAHSEPDRSGICTEYLEAVADESLSALDEPSGARVHPAIMVPARRNRNPLRVVILVFI
jgi:hypothetical protein